MQAKQELTKVGNRVRFIFSHYKKNFDNKQLQALKMMIRSL